MIEMILGATAASIFGTVTGVASTVTGLAPVRVWLKGCKTRALAGRMKPRNHDLVSGVRTAHICALDHVARRYINLLSMMPDSEIEMQDHAFANGLRAFLDKRLKVLTDKGIDHDVISIDDLNHVLEEIVNASNHNTYAELATSARKDCEKRALDELEKDTGRKPTYLFQQVFAGNHGSDDGAGWYEAFSLFVTEELKTNERFRSIFFATELVDIRSAINGIGTLLERKLTDFPDLSDFKNDMRHRLDRIEAGVSQIDKKVDRLLGHATQAQLERRSQLQSAFGGIDPASSAIYEENTTIFAWYQGGPEWWDKSANHLRSALDRLGPDYELAPRAWDLKTFDLVSPQGRSHARTGLWAGIDNASGTNHLAIVVLIGRELSEPIPCDSVFEDRLDEQGLLASGEREGGFFVAEGMARDVYRAEIRGGRIPITLETRLILEASMAGRPLLVVDGTDDGACAAEVTALLDWLKRSQIHLACAGNMISDDRWALPFVRSLFDIQIDSVLNPYRRLDHYLPENAAQFFGRDAQTQEVQEWLETCKGVLSITGPSGVGKSSFLNARVTPQLGKKGYDHIIFRPTDLGISHRQQTPVLGFCEMLSDRLGLIGLDKHPLIFMSDPEQAARAALEWARKAIPSDRQLFFAIDQFEEIVENIANGLNSEGWWAILKLVASLSGERGYPIVITLEDSRRTIYDKLMPGTPYYDATAIRLSDTDDNFVRSVITEPFADAGFTLEEGIVEQLITEFTEHSAGKHGDAGASALPLLALKLYSLFNYVTLSPKLSAKSSTQVFGDGGAPITLDDIKGFPLSITEEIKNLADQAWSDTDGGTEADLGTFLRPFISVLPTADGGDDDPGRLVLNSVPSRSFYSAVARQNAFLQRRLIVPTPGGYRLTHQAVIHRWPFAAAWFKKEAQNILQQDLFLIRAKDWNEAGRPPIADPPAEEITLAARLLALRALDWAVDNPDALPEDDRRERDFALAVFSNSTDADEVVEGSENKNRFIHVAAAYGQTGMLRHMLDKTPDAVNRARGDEAGPLSNAAWTSAEAVAFLLERGADPLQPDDKGFIPLDAPIWGGNDRVFELLLEATDPSKQPETRINPLYSAARQGRMDFIKRLEDRGHQHSAPSKHDLDSLMGAAYCDNHAVFTYCLARCDLTRKSSQGFTAFDLLATLGRTDLMLEMLRHPDGHNCLAEDPDKISTLMIACQALRATSIQFLLNAGVDPNVQSSLEESEGRTALHFALDWLARHSGPASRFVVDRTQRALEALLQDERTNVSIADKKGMTAFVMAQHHPRLQAMLVAHPTFLPSAIPAGSDTPLHSAIKRLAANRDLAMVESLKQPIHEMLADERYDDILLKTGSDKKVPAVEMVRLGFIDEIRMRIENGRLDPWEKTAGASILPAVWQRQHADLSSLVIGKMPKKTTVEQVVSLVGALSNVLDPEHMNAMDPNFSVLGQCIDRCADATLARKRSVRIAARLGNLALFDRLRADGATLNDKDAWGRDVMAQASDFLRSERARATQEAPAKPAAAKPAPDYRAVLASGELRKIEALLKTLPEGTFPDDWGRMPPDLVPDAIVEEVGKLPLKEQRPKGFFRRFRK